MSRRQHPALVTMVTLQLLPLYQVPLPLEMSLRRKHLFTQQYSVALLQENIIFCFSVFVTEFL